MFYLFVLRGFGHSRFIKKGTKSVVDTLAQSVIIALTVSL